MAQVLIIDDHDSMREGLELLLRRRGHKTLSADGGARGLALLEESGADLVITDLKMANVDGIQVLQTVQDRAPETDVLVITAYGTIEKAVEAMKLGAADFIQKPFSSEEFAVKVDRLLSERHKRAVLRKENVALRVENTYLKEDGEARYGEQQAVRTGAVVLIQHPQPHASLLCPRSVHAPNLRGEGRRQIDE